MSVQAQRVCDWIYRGKPCGEPVEEPTQFSVEAARYEMDVCDEHVDLFLALFEKPIEFARPVGIKNVSATRMVMKSRRGAFTTKDVRSWLKTQPALLKQNGYSDGKISDTGRIAQPLIDAYAEAHR